MSCLKAFYLIYSDINQVAIWRARGGEDGGRGQLSLNMRKRQKNIQIYSCIVG